MLYRLKNRGICWFFSDEFVKFISITTNLNSQKGQGVRQKKRFFLWCVKTCLKTKRTKLKNNKISPSLSIKQMHRRNGKVPCLDHQASVGYLIRFPTGMLDLVSRTSNLQSPPSPPPPPNSKNPINQSMKTSVPKKKGCTLVPLFHPYEGLQVSINANWNFVLRRKQ